MSFPRADIYYTYAKGSESVVFNHFPILIQMTFRSEILRVLRPGLHGNSHAVPSLKAESRWMARILPYKLEYKFLLNSTLFAGR